MTAGELLSYAAIFGTGLLAGEEFVVRYGVRGPLASLADEPHIRFRQALIRSLRVLVPGLFLPTLVLTVVSTLLEGDTAALIVRLGAILALLLWMAVTLAGTAPINAAALDWSPTAPPPDWHAQVDRWERLDTLRTWLAIAAFALLLAGAARQLASD